MLNSLKGLGVTLRGALRSKVTVEYPKEHLPVDKRFMGFPALTWDAARDEPFCTGCMVCGRNCASNAISGAKKEPHVIDADACERCGLCMEVCKFDAIIVK